MNINIEDANIFMMCPALSKSALTKLPPDFHIRSIRKDEIELWKRMPFDDKQTANQHSGFMTDYFERVYAPKKDVFLERCLFACNKSNQPIGTCFLWNAYDEIPTIHWFKVIKQYEGRGIGRALLSAVMEYANEYPVYLHTQAGSFRAIKLYSDFGFLIVRDPIVGSRKNEIEVALPYLKERMPERDYNNLRFGYADDNFLRVVAQHNENEF